MAGSLLRSFEVRQKDNVKAIEGLTFSFIALASVFIIFHLIRSASHGLRLRQKSGSALATFILPIRIVRKLFIHSFPFFPSTGHALTVGIYAALNVVFLFAFMNNHNFTMQSNIAARAAWLTLANMLFSVFLALKNTPLAWLTTWSYERLNVLHRYAGTFAVLHMIIHVCSYSSYFAMKHQTSVLTSQTSIYGMIAGSSFFLLGLSGILLRPWWYELFYYVHILFVAISIIMVGLHQPSLAEGFLVITIITGGMWILDRLVRVVRLVMYSANNKVTLTPLAHGGTLVTLSKSPLGASSGKHCFLWIPAIRRFETHPFTISAMDPPEFVVTSHDGFTKELHDYALAQPGVSLRASVEGSYGTFPAPTRYDKVVLIAGGSGASFTFGVALNTLKQLKENSSTKIMFVWTVRHRSFLDWYKGHLLTLTRDSRVSVHIFVTKGPQQIVDSTTDSEQRRFDGTHSIINGEISAASNSSASSVAGDAEKCVPTVHESIIESGLDLNTFAGTPIIWKRPDVPAMIRGVVAETNKDQNIVVMGCGPRSLMKQVRDTTAECIRMDGPTVELHCEQFGW